MELVKSLHSSDTWSSFESIKLPTTYLKVIDKDIILFQIDKCYFIVPTLILLYRYTDTDLFKDTESKKEVCSRI
jgi:hypothetical protein